MKTQPRDKKGRFIKSIIKVVNSRGFIDGTTYVEIDRTNKTAICYCKSTGYCYNFYDYELAEKFVEQGKWVIYKD